MSRRRYPTYDNGDAHTSEAPGVARYAFPTYDPIANAAQPANRKSFT